MGSLCSSKKTTPTSASRTPALTSSSRAGSCLLRPARRGARAARSAALKPTTATTTWRGAPAPHPRRGRVRLARMQTPPRERRAKCAAGRVLLPLLRRRRGACRLDERASAPLCAAATSRAVAWPRAQARPPTWASALAALASSPPRRPTRTSSCRASRVATLCSSPRAAATARVRTHTARQLVLLLRSPPHWQLRGRRRRRRLWAGRRVHRVTWRFSWGVRLSLARSPSISSASQSRQLSAPPLCRLAQVGERLLALARKERAGAPLLRASLALIFERRPGSVPFWPRYCRAAF